MSIKELTDEERAEVLSTLRAGTFAPEIWSKELMKELVKTMGLSKVLAEASLPDTCPLSRAIIMAGLQELVDLQPHRHIGQILEELKADGESDYEVAQRVTKLIEEVRSVCCSGHDDKTDSSSYSRRAGSTVRIRPRSTKP